MPQYTVNFVKRNADKTNKLPVQTFAGQMVGQTHVYSLEKKCLKQTLNAVNFPAQSYEDRNKVWQSCNIGASFILFWGEHNSGLLYIYFGTVNLTV